MESNANNQIRVGIFVIAGLIALGLTIFFLGGSRIFKKQVMMRAQFKQVQGLNEGSVVSLSGILIGNVFSVEFIPDTGMIELQFRLEDRYAHLITEGSTIDIRTQGALGDKYLFILQGPTNNKPLAEGSLIPLQPTTDILDVLSSQGERANRIFDILDDVSKITRTMSAENRMHVLMQKIEKSMDQLNLTLTEGQKVLQETKVAPTMKKLDSILTKIDNGEGTLGLLINDKSLHEQIKSTLGGNQRSQNFRKMFRTSIEKD